LKVFTVTSNLNNERTVILLYEGGLVEELAPGQKSRPYSELGVYWVRDLVRNQPDSEALPPSVLLEVKVSRGDDALDKTYATTRNNANFLVEVDFSVVYPPAA